MYQTLRRTARLLAAAGLIGLAPHVFAATPHTRIAVTVDVTSSQTRLEAMKVEMALLGNQATLSLPIEVHVEGESLKLKGKVPTEDLRRLALSVARQACYIPVEDHLTVCLASNSTKVSDETLQQQAEDILTTKMADVASKVKIEAQKGQLSIHGSVGSVEDKLAVSRCLRGVTGCSCVINYLKVTPLKKNGHTITLVTADGKHAIHGALPGTEAPSRKVVPAVYEEDNSTAPRIDTVSSETIELPPAPTPTLPTGLPSTPRVHLRIIPIEQAYEQTVHMTYGSQPAIRQVTELQPEPARIYPQPQGTSRIYPQPQPEQTVVTHPQSGYSTAAPAPQQDRRTLWQRLTSLRATSTPSRYQQVQVQQPVQATPTKIQPYTSYKNWPPAHHVTSGQTYSSPKTSTPAAPPVVQPTVRSVTPAQLHRAVATVCGRQATKISVETLADHTLVVHVHAAAGAEQELVGKVLQVPEVTQPGVKLQLHLPK